MRDRLVIAELYARAYKARATKSVTRTSKKVAKTLDTHKREIGIAAASSTVAFVAGHVVGFQAGYEFANGDN